MSTRADADYTLDDHDFRDNDTYARAKYDITLRWLGPAAGRSLNNVGCGAGLFNDLATAAGFRVTACEPDPDAHARAVAAAPSGCDVQLAGLEQFDAPPADVVVLHDVLEHIEDEAGAVRRLAELVRPGGVVVVSVPAQQWLFGYHDEQLGHHRRYTRRSLRGALGPRFEIGRLRSFGFAFIPVTLWFSRIRRQPYPTGSAASGGLLGRAFGAACRLETRVALPIGTSVIAEARPR